MKRIEMKIMEFLNFRACAEMFKIRFTHVVKPGGTYVVEADSKQLEIIGY